MGWLNDVYGSNPAVKLLIDPSTGRILDANTAAATFYGYSIEQLCGLRIQEINSLAPEEVAAEMALAKEGNRTFFRFRHRLASGELRHVEVYTGPVQVEGKTCLLSIIHDVTVREQALAALAKAEAQQGALLRAIPVGVAVHREGRFLWSNEGFNQIVGREPDELLGAPVNIVMPPDLEESVLERLRVNEELQLRTALTPERLLHKDGHQVPVDLRGVPLEFDGKPCRMVFVLDTSERTRLEADLGRAQRMDAVGRVAGGVAHDFNNLLLVILGAAEALARHAGSKPHFDRNVDRIREATQRAADLTKQLLLVSCGHEARGERVELADVVNEIIELVSGTLPPSIEVRVQLAHELAVVIPRSSIDQVLLNLMVNARDAMPAGGVLSVIVDEITLLDLPAAPHATLPPGRYARLQVRDSGSGMAPDVLVKAFEPFFTTKEPGKGTGLGLSTAYGIVRRAGGSIEIDSQIGEGTTVRVLLPRASDTEIVSSAPPPSSQETPVQRARGTILVVEDQRVIRELVEQTLSEAGYRVLSASCARDAIALAEQQLASVALLLTDVVMPQMRGPELAARLRETRPDLPVVFMSGYTGESLENIGVDGAELLEKPFGADALLARIDGAIARRRTIPPP